MSEPHDQKPSQPDSQSEQQAQSDLTEELRKLSQQVEQAAWSIFRNQHTRAMQRDFVSGMQELFTQMRSAAKSSWDNPLVQDLTRRGQQSLNQFQEKMQESKIGQDLQEKTARQLAHLNEQLAEFTARMQSSGEKSGPGAQSVTIEEEEHEAPAAPATQRLDDAQTDEPATSSSGEAAAAPPLVVEQDSEPAAESTSEAPTDEQHPPAANGETPAAAEEPRATTGMTVRLEPEKQE